jgi:formate hydrogenlyase subunit 6/NADH:ubiquinone oxidoreductase subunit I
VKGIAQGMATIFGRMLRPSVNEGYPGNKRVLPERARMSFGMRRDETGGAKCKACMLCERSCPDEAILIESEKRTDGPGRVLTKFTIDLGRCMYCGLCVEQCTSHGLMHTGDFEVAVPTRPETMLVIYEVPPEQKAAAPDLSENAEACAPEPSAEEGTA